MSKTGWKDVFLTSFDVEKTFQTSFDFENTYFLTSFAYCGVVMGASAMALYSLRSAQLLKLSTTKGNGVPFQTTSKSQHVLTDFK